MKKLLLCLVSILCSMGMLADNKFTATWDGVTAADLTAETAPTVSGTAGGDQASSISVSDMSWGTLSSKGGPTNIWYSSTSYYPLYAIEAPAEISDNVYLQFKVSSTSASKLVSITGLTMRWTGSSGSVVAAVKYSLDGGKTFSELSGSGSTIQDATPTNYTDFSTTNVFPLKQKNQINTTTFTATTATTAKSSVIIRIYPYSTGSYKLWCKSVVLNGTAEEPDAPATLDHITVDGKDYAASTAAENTFTISDQIFTKNPTVSYTDSKSQQSSVTMTAQNDGTSTGSFSVNGTNYSVICQNYTKVTTSKIQQLNGSTSNAGTFADPNNNGSNKNTEWSNTTANPGYTISADQAPGRFSAGWWTPSGGSKTYGFCVSGATLRFHCPANVKIEGVAIYAATWYDNVKITADEEKYIVPTSNVVANANGIASDGNQIRIIKKNPVAGEDFVITVGSQINCYFVLYGTEVEPATMTSTVSTIGYATFYSELERTIPENVEVYTGKLNGSSLILTKVEEVIPAKTAVVIKATEDNYDFAISATGAAAIADNDLKGVAAETAASSITGGTVCVLGYEDETVGFYKFNGENLAAYKAYLVVPESTPAKGISIVFDEGTATAITSYDASTSSATNENGAAYNLAGQRVAANQKGIVIINGKKFINK